MESTELTRPLPLPTPVTAPFWDGLREGRIRVQRCNACHEWVFYPRNRCSHCLSDDLEWRTIDGSASLYTFTVARQATSPHFTGDVPQLLAVVEFPEGFRMTSTLVNVAPQDIRVGMALRPVFDAVSDTVTMLRFEPA